MGSFRPEIVSHLGKGREIGEQHRDFHQASFFDMGVAASTDVGIARTAPDAHCSKHNANRARQERAAHAALRREIKSSRPAHDKDENPLRTVNVISNTNGAKMIMLYDYCSKPSAMVIDAERE